MPSINERRAVAAGLRRLEDATAHLPMSDSNFYSLLSGVVFNGANWDIHDRNPNGLFLNRLADLIEPEPERTCRLTYDTVHDDMVCSSCGAWLDMVAYSELETSGQMRYCPVCGAKVVYDHA